MSTRKDRKKSVMAIVGKMKSGSGYHKDKKKEEDKVACRRWEGEE